MIHSAIELDSITVREVMVARPDIFSLPSDLTLDEALNRVVEARLRNRPAAQSRRNYLTCRQFEGNLYLTDFASRSRRASYALRCR